MSPAAAGNDSAPQAPADVPVTVSIRRRVAPERFDEATHWVQTGMDLANEYPGFLGSGWVRAHAGSGHWHMLYKFQDAASLEAWENSIARTSWLHEGEGLVLESHVVKRTGIEGWFDESQENAGPSAPFQPPRWKQAVAIGLGFFPLNVLFTYLVTGVDPEWNDIPTVLRILLTTFVMAPTMTYLVMPFITRRLRPWLQKAPTPKA
ncbi:antibiotic biosynthesis monooxygenase [Cryobacterium soli]|jgi:antibiotic biosynthesis monooxygenase (ABM) superfamily enzyme|uniref:antibiotic biosynthesis monooxygenase n=1 Tax=Cryobacterium soli TaxID=2220095 RepID=UPI000E746789|nr:antibiotic biosynthesis monooxygenase [Cryobacterium soli]